MSPGTGPAARHREPLPAPRGGWPVVTAFAVLAAVPWAVVAFTVMALLLPAMELRCHMGPADTKVCLREQDPDPLAARLLDPRWPQVGFGWAVVILTVSLLLWFVFVGVAMQFWAPWPGSDGDFRLAHVSAVGGVGLGLLVAGPGFRDPRTTAGVTCLGLLAGIAAGYGLRWFAKSLRHAHAVLTRTAELRQHGRVARALVTGFTEGPSQDLSRRRFTVTARIAADAADAEEGEGRTVTGEIEVAIRDAPVVGGTVLVRFDERRDHPSGVGILMEADPESVRDPGAEGGYAYDPAPG
ncbi:hypothetical protein [Streptomyces sp. NPDC058045]|uniref:hypothetical protein n=1 Tax=Streptomyces sp. NPDC058045 TaxID=3346311 RepID=UPI0036F0916C